MAFRVRQGVEGKLEVEVDTAGELAQLLAVMRPARGAAPPLLLEASPLAAQRLSRKRRVKAGRRPRAARAKAPATPEPKRDELLHLIARGVSVAPAMARALQRPLVEVSR